MSLLSKLFGGGKSGPEPDVHDGFRITAMPEGGPGGYRIGAKIEKEIGGEVKTHHMIRADQCSSAEEAAELSVAKAKMLIDQQGEAIFG